MNCTVKFVLSPNALSVQSFHSLMVRHWCTGQNDRARGLCPHCNTIFSSTFIISDDGFHFFLPENHSIGFPRQSFFSTFIAVYQFKFELWHDASESPVVDASQSWRLVQKFFFWFCGRTLSSTELLLPGDSSVKNCSGRRSRFHSDLLGELVFQEFSKTWTLRSRLIVFYPICPSTPIRLSVRKPSTFWVLKQNYLENFLSCFRASQRL